MKKWLLIWLLGAPLAWAQETPPPPEPESDPAVQAAVEAALAEPPPPPDGAPVLTVPAPTTPEAAATQPATLPTTSPTTLPTSAPTTAAATGPSTGPTTSTAWVRPPYSRDSGRSSRAATAYPRTVAMAKPMPREFELVIARSIFIKGMQRVRDTPPPSDPGRERPGGSGPTTTVVVARPEKKLLFNGATDADGQWVAIFEDVSVAKVLTLKVGDKVARGKVAAMTLGTLDYDAGGRVKRILMGQNLDGEVVAVATTRPSLAAVGGPATGPSPGPEGGPPAAGGAASILEQMRLRRLQGK
jgi:hypothetical protein